MINNCGPFSRQGCESTASVGLNPPPYENKPTIIFVSVESLFQGFPLVQTSASAGEFAIPSGERLRRWRKIATWWRRLRQPGRRTRWGRNRLSITVAAADVERAQKAKTASATVGSHDNLLTRSGPLMEFWKFPREWNWSFWKVFQWKKGPHVKILLLASSIWSFYWQRSKSTAELVIWIGDFILGMSNVLFSINSISSENFINVEMLFSFLDCWKICSCCYM